MTAARVEPRRVLALVGTKGPFPRLVDALAAVAAETGWDVRAQHASDAPPAGLAGWKLLPRERLLAELAEADAVVCHAGSGALRDALAAGHRPIVVARVAWRGEHVNDHQAELVAALGERIAAIADVEGAALVAALRAAITQARRGSEGVPPGEELRASVRAELEGIARAAPSRRTAIAYRVLGWAFARLARPGQRPARTAR